MLQLLLSVPQIISNFYHGKLINFGILLRYDSGFYFSTFLAVAENSTWSDEQGTVLEKIQDLYRKYKILDEAKEQHEQEIEELTSMLDEKQKEIQLLKENDKLKGIYNRLALIMCLLLDMDLAL